MTGKVSDRNIHSALQRYCEIEKQTIKHKLIEEVCNSIGLAPSIDNYLYTHQNDNITQLLGKTSIVSTILEKERKCKLFYDNTIEPYDSHSKSCHVIQKNYDTWIHSLFDILRESKESIDTIFDNVSFICFNYDRCIEQYFSLAIQAMYRISEEKAQEITNKLVILRPYGSVGNLPWQNGDSPSVSFGQEIRGDQLLEQSKRIRTFSEQLEDGKIVQDIKDTISSAKSIIFLGMAFHKQNMDILSPDIREMGTVIGTSYEMSEINTNIVKTLIMNKIKNTSCVDLVNVKASQLIKDYRNYISAY